MLIFARLQSMYKSNQISGEQFFIINAEFQFLTDFIGACERIKNTPIPFTYSIFIKKFIFLYVITMPFGFVYDFGYWTIPIVMVVFYVLASLELIAEEIEDPFGRDDDDLPTDELSTKIDGNIKEILL
jgi:putative membrane protein